MFRKVKRLKELIGAQKKKNEQLNDTLCIYNHYIQILREALDTENQSYWQGGFVDSKMQIRRFPSVRVCDAEPVFTDTFTENSTSLNSSLKALTISTLERMGFQYCPTLKVYVKRQ